MLKLVREDVVVVFGGMIGHQMRNILFWDLLYES